MSSSDRLARLKTRRLLVTPSNLPSTLSSDTYTNLKAYVLASQVYASATKLPLHSTRLPQPGKTIINNIDVGPDDDCVTAYPMCKDTDSGRENRQSRQEGDRMYTFIPVPPPKLYRKYFDTVTDKRKKVLLECERQENCENLIA
jgi:hypothetical protein